MVAVALLPLAAFAALAAFELDSVSRGTAVAAQGAILQDEQARQQGSVAAAAGLIDERMDQIDADLGQVVAQLRQAIAAAAPAQERNVPPTVVRIVGPSYPYLAILAGVEGSVTLLADVTSAGAVERVRAVSGHELLVDSARRALQRWRFRCTASVDTCQAEIVFTFKLLDEICNKASCDSELEIDLPSSVTIRAKRLPPMVDASLQAYFRNPGQRVR